MNRNIASISMGGNYPGIRHEIKPLSNNPFNRGGISVPLMPGLPIRSVLAAASTQTFGGFAVSGINIGKEFP